MFKVLGVLAAGCAVLVTAAPARAELTPDGPATVMYRYAGGHTAEGRTPQVLMAVRIAVGAGGRAGTVRLRRGDAPDGDRGRRAVHAPGHARDVHVPRAARPRATTARSARHRPDRPAGTRSSTQEACRPEPAVLRDDPCQFSWLDVFCGQPGARRARRAGEDPGARLDFVPVYEYDSDGDLRGDESEDRTDLQLRIRSRKDARGRSARDG